MAGALLLAGGLAAAAAILAVTVVVGRGSAGASQSVDGRNGLHNNKAAARKRKRRLAETNSATRRPWDLDRRNQSRRGRSIETRSIDRLRWVAGKRGLWTESGLNQGLEGSMKP